MAGKNPTGEPDPTPFKIHLMTRAGRVVRARSGPVGAFSTKEEAVRFAGRQLGGHYAVYHNRSESPGLAFLLDHILPQATTGPDALSSDRPGRAFAKGCVVPDRPWPAMRRLPGRVPHETQLKPFLPSTKSYSVFHFEPRPDRGSLTGVGLLRRKSKAQPPRAGAYSQRPTDE
jgi:hypothetical protein